jgi:hypothetical protein
MGQIASTPTSIRRYRRFRRWTTALAALAGLLVAASASAVPATQDLRSPDARAGVVAPAQPATQDLRSPDARAPVAPAQPATQDLRSPDARAAGRFVSSPQDSTGSSGRPGWVYLALAGLLSLTVIGGSVLLVQRHRRHAIATGG